MALVRRKCFSTYLLSYKRDVYDKIGGLYREDFPVQGDWEFNLRFIQRFEIALLREHLAFYHHRVIATGKPSAYSNTVLDRVNAHRFYTTYLRNEFLRTDLAQGKFGIGYMLNTNPLLFRLERMSSRVMKIWDMLKAPLAKARSVWPRVRRH